MPIAQFFDPGIAVSDYLDFTFDWTDWLPTGDTISAAVVTGAPGLTVSSALISGPKVTVWVSNAVLNVSYALTCQITTAGNRIANRSATLNCSAL